MVKGIQKSPYRFKKHGDLYVLVLLDGAFTCMHIVLRPWDVIMLIVIMPAALTKCNLSQEPLLEEMV